MLYAVVTELGEIVAVSVEGQEPSLGGAGHNVSHRSTDNALTYIVLHILSLSLSLTRLSFYFCLV